MKRFTIIALIICLLINLNCFADTTTLAQLDYKLKVLEDLNGKLVNSIYWTIALVGTIFSAIVALNFYQNFTLNTKKIDTIKSELNEHIEKLKKELEEVNNNRIDASLSLIDSKVQNIADKKFSDLHSKFTRLENDYKDLKRENLIAKAEKHKSLGQRGHLLNYLEILKLDLEKKYDWRTFETLEKLKEIAIGEHFSAEDASRFQEALKTALESSEKYEQIITLIKSNIRII
jgi:hypothetical protein